MKKFFTILSTGIILSSMAATKPMSFDEKFYQKPEFTSAKVNFRLPANVKAIYINGPKYKGKDTKIFACYGVPKTPGNQKIPGVILLHGSGGTAFANWVALWNSRGYAAIAVDYHGRMPRGAGWKENSTSMVIPNGGPQENQRYKMGLPQQDSFTYHAVSSVLLAHSVLALQNNVDKNKIGLVGISMGAVLSLRLAGIDPRLNFVTAIYGCGHIMKGTLFGDRSKKNYKMSDKDVQEYIDSHDPAVYLKLARCPVFFVNSTNDPFFRTLPWNNSIAEVKSGAYQSMKINLRHSHVDSDVPEVKLFADWCSGRNIAIPRISTPVRLDNKLGAAINGVKNSEWKAELIWTKDKGLGSTRKWQSSPAEFNAAGNQLEAELPQGCRNAFFRVSNKSNAGFSSPHWIW
jgi:dienelactone hydrolase